MLSLAGARAWRPPIVETVATDGSGVDELWTAIAAHREHLAQSDELSRRRAGRVREELRGLVLERLQAIADATCSGAAFDELVEQVASHDIDAYAAVATLLDNPGGKS
jgi:LAO/AO transport system kinase